MVGCRCTGTTGETGECRPSPSAALLSGLIGTVGGTVAGSAAGVVAGVGATAVGILGGARSRRDEALAASPVSFLLCVEKGLSPTTAVRRIGRALRRGAGADV
ncbi:hypothetical protein [Streptomyces pilosus]|uniref:hypothetical protein n=1 Tax=Streptomyces pilosus TaxID=28893 RepID=UPI00363CA3C6